MKTKLICEDCKRSRHTSSGKIICTTIGVPEMAFRYGKCRRFEPRRKRGATFEDAAPVELCEGCLFFVAGTDSDPDYCMEEPTAEDTTTDHRQVITKCKLYKAK